jgi:hypothetical protein
VRHLAMVVVDWTTRGGFQGARFGA